jgi:hypothetical protein
LKYTYKILTEIDPEKWDSDLSTVAYATTFQTAEYLSYESFEEKKTPFFIYVYDETGNVKGQLGLVVDKSVSMYSSPILNRIVNFFAKLGSRALWVHGPILNTQDKKARIEILSTIIEALETLTAKENIVLVGGYTPHGDYLIDEDYKNEFKRSGYKIIDQYTFATNLNENIDNIWNNLTESAKRDVTRAKKRNILVRELEYKDLHEYFSLGQQWAKTKGIEKFVPLKQREEFWKYYKSGVEKIFLAYEEGELVTAHRLACFNGVAYSHKITNSYSKPTSLGGPLLTWHAIEWAKNAGMKIYDFSGGLSPPSNEKERKKYEKWWSGLFSYKKKWGGHEYPYYNVLKIRRKKTYKLFRVLAKIDWSYRNYKHQRYKKPKKV